MDGLIELNLLILLEELLVLVELMDIWDHGEALEDTTIIIMEDPTIIIITMVDGIIMDHLDTITVAMEAVTITAVEVTMAETMGAIMVEVAIMVEAIMEEDMDPIMVDIDTNTLFLHLFKI